MFCLKLEIILLRPAFCFLSVGVLTQSTMFLKGFLLSTGINLASERGKKNCTSRSATSHLFCHFGLQLRSSRPNFWKYVKTCLEVLNIKPGFLKLCTFINICTILWSLSLSFLKLCVHI